MKHHVLVTFVNPLVIQTEPPPAVLAEIKQIVSKILMTTTEAFESMAKNSDKLRKALGEVREKIDALTALIADLQNGKLTTAQQKIVDDIDTVAQELDDVVPDAPPEGNPS